jgi:NhaA family Na+:H+ antiporter
LLGIAGATFVGLRLGWGSLPESVSRPQVWGIAALGGIGFTVSLFIAQLGYASQSTIDSAKVGIFAGSLLSAGVGALILFRAKAQAP